MHEAKIDKILSVKKPAGFSTYDLIRIFKRETHFTGRIGHGGSLDPFATGVVLLLLGEATSKFEAIKDWEKVYLAGIRLGASSTTEDAVGEIKITEDKNKPTISKSMIEKTLQGFTGTIEQKVPYFSAAKHEGVPLYKLAKKGIAVEKRKTVNISNIELLNLKWPLLTIRVFCSGGVYIRQLAHDIGEKLGCGGFLYFLERERVGEFTLKDCFTIEDFKNKGFLRSISGINS